MTQDLKAAVKTLYGATAEGAARANGDAVARVAAAFGYSAEELAALPEGANLGLSCGNPTAAASLKLGETVLDLGSGGGLDVFLAAKAVGPEGEAIGLDMTEEMIALARRNAEKAGHANVRFVLGDIEDMPLGSASVDCVISNCVINLTSDKNEAFREIFRVLRPGGRVAISDIALKQKLPEALAESVDAYVGCIAGAISREAFETGLAAAGFEAVAVIEDGSDLNAYAELGGQAACCTPAAAAPASSCCGPSEAPSRDVAGALLETLASYDLNAFAASVKVYAVKPAHG